MVVVFFKSHGNVVHERLKINSMEVIERCLSLTFQIEYTYTE